MKIMFNKLISNNMNLIMIVLLIVTILLAGFGYVLGGFSYQITIGILLVLFIQSLFANITANAKLQHLESILERENEYKRVSFYDDDETSMLERFIYEIYSMIDQKDSSLGEIYDYICKRFDRYYDSFRVFRDNALRPRVLMERIERIKQNGSLRHMSFPDFYEEVLHMPYRNNRYSHDFKEYTLRDEMLLEKIQRAIAREMDSSRYIDANAISRNIIEKIEKTIISAGNSLSNNNSKHFELNDELIEILKKSPIAKQKRLKRNMIVIA